MAEREVGIIISVKNRATKEIVGVGRAAKGAAALLGKMGTVGSGALAIVSNAANAINQALEIGKKALETFNMVVTESINKAIEFRHESDPMVKFWKSLQNEANLTRARFGDALLPVVRGFVETMDKASGKLSDFIEKNRDLISVRIAEWATSAGKGLIIGLAEAAKIVGNAFDGIKLAAATVEQAVAAMVVGSIDLLSEFLGYLRELANNFGADSLVKKIDNIQVSLGGLSSEFEASGIAAAGAADESTKAIQAWNREVDQIASGADRVISGVTANVKRLTGEMTNGLKQTQDQLANTGWKIDQLLRTRLKAIDMELAAKENQTQKLVELDEKQRESARALADTIGSTIGQSFADIITGAQSVEEAFKSAAAAILQTVIQQVTATIAAKAAEAAVSAGASQAAVPVIGPALAVSAAAAMFAAMTAYATKFATGGVVPGPRLGRDIVPAMLTPGERVLTVDQNKEYERRTDSGRAVNITFAPTIQTLEISSETQQRRMMVQLANELEKLIKDGVVLRSVGAAAAR